MFIWWIEYLQNKSSYEILYGEESDLSTLRDFGCLCYASTLLHNRHKFDPKVRKCDFLGYKQRMNGFVLLDIHA